MRVTALCLSLVALQARADIPPLPSRPDLSCVGQPEGATCGEGGRCVKQVVRRPDFSKGGIPTWVTTEVTSAVRSAVAVRPFAKVERLE